MFCFGKQFEIFVIENFIDDFYIYIQICFVRKDGKEEEKECKWLRRNRKV